MGSIAEEEREADPSLDELNGFRERIEPLDRLDAYPLDWQLSTLDCESVDAGLYRRAKALYAQLEAANLKLYENIRSAIHRGAGPYLASVDTQIGRGWKRHRPRYSRRL